MSTHIETDLHGLPALAFQAPDGATAVVTLHGAHVVSWRTGDGQERLYLSEHSPYQDGKPIRGGIPLVFPQFSNFGELPRHGFARTLPWQVEQRHTGSEHVGVTLSLRDSAQTLALWPFPFRAELTVSIARNRLDVEFSITNTGEAPMSFTAALHTYLRVAHIESTQLMGLQGCTYRDQTAGGTERIERHQSLDISQETDRIYLTAPGEVMLRQPDHSMNIQSTNFPDLVVWNPWVEKCALMPDMPPDGFKRMLCVEAAAIEQPVRLPAGAEWWGRQSLVAMK